MKSDEPFRLGDYEIHRAREGFSSIRQISSGEIMHSRTDPMAEAHQLYVEQARLADRLRENSAAPLILWDVGLGAAANAMAAIECSERVPRGRPLRIFSFENDLDPLRLAVTNIQSFPYLRGDSASAILADGEWRGRDQRLSWKLCFGDFQATMKQASTPDVIFYDMFSTKTSAQFWTARIFRQIFAACAGRAVELFTYTCSTANRAALLAAGFFVARGRNAGDKVETTIALTPAVVGSGRAETRGLLSSDWLAKWERSAAKFPADVAPNEHSAFEKIIRGHEQFRKSTAPNVSHPPDDSAMTEGLPGWPGLGITGDPPSHGMMWQAKTTQLINGGKNMADEKSGKKPDKEGGSGAEKGDDASEAGGRRRHLLYTCWNDGAGNYVHANWSWFTCWRCGALNYM